MVWRPVAIMRGPMRDKGRAARPRRPRRPGGARRAVLVPAHRHRRRAPTRGCSAAASSSPALATLLVIAAVTHQRRAGRAGCSATRCSCGSAPAYGLYLFHWPIYQIIRKVAGRTLSRRRSSSSAMVITVVVTELSYRFIETPIRQRPGRALVAPPAVGPRPGAAPASSPASASAVVAAARCSPSPTWRRAELQAERDRRSRSTRAPRPVTDLERPARRDHDGADRRRPARRSRRPTTARRRAGAPSPTGVPAPTTAPPTDDHDRHRPRCRRPAGRPDLRHRRLGDARRGAELLEAKGIVVDAESAGR